METQCQAVVVGKQCEWPCLQKMAKNGGLRGVRREVHGQRRPVALVSAKRCTEEGDRAPCAIDKLFQDTADGQFGRINCKGGALSTG